MLAGDYVRRCAAEFVGVFAVVFVAAGGAAYAQSPIDLALAYGLVIAVFVSAFGPVSGGHFNPAVTLGYLVTRRITAVLAVAYWVTQFAAAALAGLLLKYVLPTAARSAGHLGAVHIGSGATSGTAVVVETVLTFFLVWVVFATAVDERGAFRQIAGLAIGFAIAFDVLMGYGISGAAMNPARAFGPQLDGHQWSHFWVWYVGPFAGAVIAAALYELLYLRPKEQAGAPETAVDDTATGDTAAP